ncbi:NusG domain II-containing protein [Paenibacillus lentus]|uniref:NusG domain II-containing protein n=1 Tax=Paenibacillus lentus TaxID=1338368 RepID=A0A3Q8S8T4_9BACL|nr:NusG domain II-containing protein [Paenibacillus lentus]AZK44925.1 NusG domain II-containing protein [Paenibacillus lentus]
MKRGDVLLVSLIVVIALAFLIPRWLFADLSEKNHNNTPLVANIKVDGKLVRSVELTEEEQIIEIETEDGLNILKVHDYGIEMIEADCPDQLCLTFGFVKRDGGAIVCLPHKMIVEIEGDLGEGDDIDAIVK